MGFRRNHEAPDHAAAGASSVVGDGDGDGHSERGGNRRRAGRISVKLSATFAVLAGCALLASATTWSNLNATATNPANSFLAGTVKIASNSGSSAVLSLTNAKPGAVSTGCIQVTYTGTLPANVKLYGTGAGSGLNQYLTLVVTRGTFSGTPAAGSCTGFTADTTNYISQGAGVMYSGTLASWPATATTAQVDPTSANPESWTANETHGYQLQVTLGTNTAAQGLTGTETFTFEADNS
jgi:hypothetical protein